MILGIKNYQFMMEYSVKSLKGAKFRIRKGIKEDLEEIHLSFVSREYNPKGFEIKKKDTVIDIGAYIGSFAVYAAKSSKKGIIYAYEPYPENFALLKENIKINKLSNVKIFNLGVLGKEKKANLYINEKNNASHTIYINTKNFVKINCTSLKAIFDENKINFCDFLKMDCEGAEYDILFNTPNEYFDKIGKIALEYHDYLYRKPSGITLLFRKMGFKMKDKPGLDDLIALLKKRGFREIKLKKIEDIGRGILYAKRKS